MSQSINSLRMELQHQNRKILRPSWLDIDPIYIYGIGKTGQEIALTLQTQGINVAGFIDQRAGEGSDLQGLQMFAPNSPLLVSRGHSTIILAIHNREVDIPALITWLQSLGYEHFISLVDAYDIFDLDLSSPYWLTHRNYYTEHIDEIESTIEIFADRASQALFESILRFRVGGDFNLLPPPDSSRQYMPSDLPPWKSPLRFVDCGAYTGDTLLSFAAAGYQFEAIAAFEADQDNFRDLVQTVQTHKFANSTLWPCGVYSKTTQVRFSSDRGEASIIAEHGDRLIQCVALDDAIPFFSPTLIKMDIEGAELDALQGAAKLIAAYQPGLALSVYHAPAHLWQIPLWVSRFAEKTDIDYTYHLRAHGENCFDTVFYAIPRGSRK